MKPRMPMVLGAAIGLAAAMLVIGYARTPRHDDAGAMLADHGGHVQSVVMQYVAGSQFVLPVYKQYLAQQSPDMRVYLVCPEAGDFQELRDALGVVPPKFVPVFTHHTMTAWSRDRWVALVPAKDAGEKRITLLAPKGENAGEVWPQREGDSRIADDLAGAFPDLLQAKRSGLFFDGGDYLADGERVFASRALFERNIQHSVTSREQLMTAIATDVNRKVVLMEGAPDHHVGMYMMAAGPGPDGMRRMVVADPSLGKPLFDDASPEAGELEDGADFSAEMQARFDYVAGLAEAQGYKVTRIPVVVPKVGKTYLTYVNVILEKPQGAGAPIVYMSAYAGQPKMNAAAAEVWKGLGYEVRPIDCSTVWTKGGTLHCLVNVLQRE